MLRKLRAGGQSARHISDSKPLTIRSARRIALQPARQSFTSFNSPASNPSFNPYLNTGGYGASAQSYDTQVTAFGFRGATSASIDRTTDSHLANQARDTYEAGDYGLNVKIGNRGKEKGGKVEEKGKGAEGKGKERGERETKETQMQETIMSKTERARPQGGREGEGGGRRREGGARKGGCGSGKIIWDHFNPSSLPLTQHPPRKTT